jgi:hypothetical protein
MLQSLAKVLGGSLILGSGVLAGNYWYVHKEWKASHPLVAEALAMALKDPRIVKELGPRTSRSGSVSGVLEPDKTWSNANFRVSGLADAVITVVADGKKESEAGDEFFPLGKYPPPKSTWEWAWELWNGKNEEEEEIRWRIVALSVRFDEVFVLHVITDGGKTHKQIREAKGVIQDVEEGTVGERRKMGVLKKITNTYWWMFLGGFFVTIAGVYSMKYFKQYPVKNSTFLMKGVEILKTDEFVRKNLGTPIHLAQNLKGSLNYNKTKGDVKGFVYGPSGWAKVHLQGNFDKTTKNWRYSKISVHKEGVEHELKTS